MTLTCPKGHESDDAEFCSECGIRMQGGTAIPAPPEPASGACPDCGTPRTPGARFCEACRYDFQGGARTAAPSQPPAPPVAATASPSASPVAAPPPAQPVAAAAEEASPFYGKSAWARVVADRLLAGPEDAADFPADEPERSYPLDFAENLVGRKNGRAGVHPEVPVNDRSVSARHIKLCRRPAGMVLIDLGSTNGTRVNGSPVEAGVEVAVSPGDRIEIGAWTRLVLEAR